MSVTQSRREKIARKFCVIDGKDPDQIISGQARWLDYALDAEALIGLHRQRRAIPPQKSGDKTDQRS